MVLGYFSFISKYCFIIGEKSAMCAYQPFLIAHGQKAGSPPPWPSFSLSAQWQPPQEEQSPPQEEQSPPQEAGS